MFWSFRIIKKKYRNLLKNLLVKNNIEVFLDILIIK